MQVFPIESAADHARAMAIIDAAWDADLQGAELEAFDALCALVDAWEAREVPFGAADPIEVIQSKLLELRWSQRELARRLGWTSSGRVSEILGRKRPLTMKMVQDLARALDIPPGALVQDTRDMGAGGRWMYLAPGDVEMARQAARLRQCSLAEFVTLALLEATS